MPQMAASIPKDRYIVFGIVTFVVVASFAADVFVYSQMTQLGIVKGTIFIVGLMIAGFAVIILISPEHGIKVMLGSAVIGLVVFGLVSPEILAEIMPSVGDSISGFAGGGKS